MPGTPKLERYRSSRLTSLRAFRVRIELDHGARDQGILIAHGDQGGGYVVYVEDERLALAWNEYGSLREADGGPLAPGSRVVFARRDLAARIPVDVALLVDDVEVAHLENLWMLVGFVPFSDIDVGRGSGGPVHWGLHQRHGNFLTSGRLHAATWVPGEVADYDPAQVVAAEIETALFYDSGAACRARPRLSLVPRSGGRRTGTRRPALTGSLVARGCWGFSGGRRGFGDEVGEDASEAPAGGAAGQAAVFFEGFVSGRNRELLIEYASAGEA